jgi:DNA repair exonuclease SbcCD nuclease subunit
MSRPGGIAKQNKFKNMKTFLVVAGLLMAGASVYGVVDYSKKSSTKEFKELYKEAPAPVEDEVVKEEMPVPIIEKKEISKTNVVAKTEKPPVKKIIKKKTVKKKKERTFELREFSRSKLG